LSSESYFLKNQKLFSKIKDTKTALAFTIATSLGAGLFPIAPGTMGSLFGIPLAYFLRDLPVEGRILIGLFLIAIGTWAAKIFDQTMETSDNQNIVIDEVIGMGISSWTAGNNPKTWVAAFLLFRFFDVLKPFPVRQIDRWSKNQSSAWWKGFGVIADDIGAGFQALAVIYLLQYWLNWL
jgi:phosphatidylglycerophosphatase A